MCHNSRDFEQVAAIAACLRERGILPWLAPREIRPGQRWPDELHENLKSVGSVAVFVGPKGTGPWQDLEVELALQEFARRKRPIIPVILDGRPGNPKFPAFLDRNWIGR